MFHCKRAFSKKAQHLQRWIPLRTFTRGRLVPRQPRAIKRTTPTALHHERIYNVKYIHWNTGIKPTALQHYNIRNGVFIHGNAAIKPMALHGRNIHHGGFIHGNTGIKPTALRGRNIHNRWCILMRTAHDLTHFKPFFDPFHLVIPTFLRGKMNGITAIVEFTWFTSQRLDCGWLQCSLVPFQAHFEATACPETAHFALFPAVRQGR